MKHSRYSIMQWLCAQIIAPFYANMVATGNGYAAEGDTYLVGLVGEDEFGTLYGPDRRVCYWFTWDVFRRGHLAAAIRSRRSATVVMLENGS